MLYQGEQIIYKEIVYEFDVLLKRILNFDNCLDLKVI